MGSPETVQSDANENFEKITQIFLLASNTSNPYIKSRLKSIIVDWFINRAGGHGLYTDDPVNEPNQAQRILATDIHDNYPRPVDFLTELHTNITVSSNEGAESRRDANLLYETMYTLTQQYPNIFSSYITLLDEYSSNQKNIYYDISSFNKDSKIAGVIFLNVPSYVVHRALPGELIVIHGLDQMSLPVQTIVPYKKVIRSKNLGLITVFEERESDINPISFSEFCGPLSRQDMVVI